MKKLLPILLVIIGIGGGVGAGLALRPEPADMADKESMPKAEKAEKKPADDSEKSPAEEDREYVKLNNQFVVPVIQDDRVRSMVVLSLSVEVRPGEVESVFSREPKLRDAFLQVLFDHANVGGFDGVFTNSTKLDVLRTSLREASYHAVGDLVTDVLIMEFARQDV